MKGITLFSFAGLFFLVMFALVQIETLKNGNWSHDQSEECDFHCRTKQFPLFRHVTWVGENLYSGDSCDIRDAINAWEESSGHRAILDRSYDTGVLFIVPRPEGGCYITLDVGTSVKEATDH